MPLRNPQKYLYDIVVETKVGILLEQARTLLKQL